MKKRFISAAFLLIVISISFTSCKKNFFCHQVETVTTTITTYDMKPQYSGILEQAHQEKASPWSLFQVACTPLPLLTKCVIKRFQRYSPCRLIKDGY